MADAQPNQKPAVSVIIPAYNTAHLIAACLDSVLSQSFLDFEVMVVNDGSPDTDNLESVLQPYRERIVYITQENKRAAGARNTAIRRARGEFLAFLDSDDTWFPDHLSSQMRLFDADPALGLVYSNALIVGDPPRQYEFMEKCPSVGRATFEALVVERCQVPISTVVARKSTVVQAGLFDETLLRCDDYEMWLRAAFHGAKIGYSRKIQARLSGVRPGSLGQSNARMTEAYWRILEKADQTLPLKDSDRSLVRKRAEEIRVRYLVEEGKCKLSERQFDKAVELFSEANKNLRLPKLRLALLGLRIAPNLTSQLVSFWSRIRDGVA